MYKHILIVHSDVTILEAIGDILKDACASENFEVALTLVKSQNEAESLIKENLYDLVITNLEIPHDRKSTLPVGRKKKPGLELVKSLRQQQIDVPAIILAGDVDQELFQPLIDLVKNVEVVSIGEKLSEELTQKSKRLLSQEEQVKIEAKVNLDIILNLEKPEFGWSLHCQRFHLEDSGPLFVAPDELQNLILASRAAASSEDWEELLRDIGQRLARQIFCDRNLKLLEEFFEARGQVGGLENARIRFFVEEKVHPVVLEALTQEGEEFWMLKASIYRKLQQIPGQYALFQDEETRKGPLNCLIIQSNASGLVKGLGQELKPLAKVEQEAKWLEQYLLTHRAQLGIGEVKRISATPKGHSFKEEVKKTLVNGVWQIVHYAGHSVYDKEQKTGYLIFPGRRMPEEVGIPEFANWLVRTQAHLVSLSSCQSTETEFVWQLARNNVPAVVGFRWKIDDDKAEEYTKSFYEQLFSGEKSLEGAFLKARQDMHAKYTHNRIWAAPMLLMNEVD